MVRKRARLELIFVHALVVAVAACGSGSGRHSQRDGGAGTSGTGQAGKAGSHATGGGGGVGASTTQTDGSAAPDDGGAADAAAHDAATVDRDAGPIMSGADASTPSPTTGPKSCDGIDCSGHGSCFINQHGVAECKCDREGCWFPTEDLRCVAALAFCDEAMAKGFSCNGSAWCGIPAVNPCTCEATGPLVPTCICAHTVAQFYDGTDCVDDVRGCHDPAECPYPDDDKWQIEVTGSASFMLLDRSGSNWDWTNEYLKLYNDWPAGICGYAILRGLALPAGVHSASELSFGVGYDNQYWSTLNPGAAGIVNVQRWQWCDTFDCNVVEIELDLTLANEAGATVHASGYIRGDMF